MSTEKLIKLFKTVVSNTDGFTYQKLNGLKGNSISATKPSGSTVVFTAESPRCWRLESFDSWMAERLRSDDRHSDNRRVLSGVDL